MKAKSTLYFVMLIVWMGGSTYWYVCKIQHDCKEEQDEVLGKVPKIAQKSQQVINLEIKKASLAKEKKTSAHLKEKLAKGYIVSGFPSNASANGQLNNNFNDFVKDLKLYIAENKDAKIGLSGHTDLIGTVKSNLILGEKRAGFIKNKLIEQGIPTKNIVLSSKGETAPIAPNTTETGRAKNRRVEIKLLNE